MTLEKNLNILGPSAFGKGGLHKPATTAGSQWLLYVPPDFTLKPLPVLPGTAVAQWLRCCAQIGRSLVRSQLVAVDFSLGSTHPVT